MRSKFTSTGFIDVSEIMLDQNNYRLGLLDSQIDCINIMFEEFGPKILKIAGHIAQNGISPKPIVISKDKTNNRWIVRDGNRRITAIKLLNNPAEAPDHYRRYFQTLQNSAIPGMIPEKIECLTADEAAIIEYTTLEHMGPQDGIGLVPWDLRAKENMQADLEGKPLYPIGSAICGYLEKKGVTEAGRVSISNMQRLFQDTEVSKRLGIDWDGQRLKFVANEDEVFAVLKEIVTDFTKKENKLRVRDIYYPRDRTKYIDDLFEHRGFKKPTPLGEPDKEKHTARGKPPWDRKRVIQRNAGLPTPNTETKLNTILVELSSGIDVRDATIASGVLIRLILERSVDYYAKKNKITFAKKESLANRIGKVADKMKMMDIIDIKQHELLKKMSRSEELISAHTLNAWVHNSQYIPEPRHVCTFWDNIYFFLYTCWKWK